jgi:hypothetical protein
MRKLPVVSAVIVGASFFVAACGGGSPASGGPAIPSIAIPSLAIPSISIPSNLIPSGLTIPSIAVPSVQAHPDPELAARFPTAIPGATLGPVTTGRFIDVVNAFKPETAQQFTAAVTGAGLDPNTLTYGSQAATLNESDVVQIQGLRTPGADANRFAQIFPQIEQIVNGEADTLGQSTVGGKTVQTLTDSDGNVDYLYVTNDVVWRLSGADETEAGTIITALH